MGSELTKQESAPLAVFPDHLKNVSGREGLENVRQEHLVLPRLSICQSMTPQRKEQNSNFIEGLKEGQLFNTVTSEIYGKLAELIPLIFSPSRILFRDLDEGGGILCQSFNGINGGSLCPTCAACPNSKWSGSGEERRAPVCTEFANYPAFVIHHGRPTMLVASFKNTALKPARSWLTRMSMLVNPVTKQPMPLYSAVYEVSTNPEKNAKGQDYFAPVFKFKRWTSPEEFKLSAAEYENLKGKTITTDETHDEGGSEAVPF